ncbi:MAG TPA: PKD domain-containing protein, partial [Ilumatobacteraceae bacterium]|nr:PKD domain-containing protein [Ilumatobacteraceae bacterium]
MTPIASYSFDWGDGSAATVVNAPAQIATHTYASAGTYTVTLIATDTGALASTPKTASITVNPPAPDLPPVASLAVTQMGSPPLTVSASGAGSTDADVTPIASYSFDWGDGTTATVVNAPAQAATHTYASAGPYTVTLVVTDTGAQASAPTTAGITVSTSVAVTTVEARVSASSDDAEQALTGSMSLTSSDLELIKDSADQIVGMRWTGLAIPTGATIRAAWIQFMSKASQSVVTNLVLRAQAADNAATFTSTSNNISSRPLTTASAAWAPVAWTSGLAGADQRTPDLSAVVQEVVNRGGWAFGNALAIVVSGTGQRTAWAWNGSATSAALLHIEYSGGSAPVDNAPVASLAVTQAPSPPLTVSASAAGSTDTDPTPIASYTFNWGDGSAATVINAPAQTATHTYAGTGTYTVTLTAKDTGGLTSQPATASVTVVATPAAKVAVYVGYYDTHHHATTLPKPSPWEGSPGVVFVGKADDSAYNWDSSALRVDNLTGADMSVVVSCHIGSKSYDLWGTRTIPANGKLILAQTGFQNFDGSDTSPAGCYGCDPSLCLTKVVSTIPVIHVTVAGVLTNYYDNTQVLNTKGADGAGCPYTGGRNDESQQWKQIGTTAALVEGSADENGEFIPDAMTFDAPAP